ncbi:hypothetical protein KIW84_074064, partial [Lathyrus oleraceus]
SITYKARCSLCSECNKPIYACTRGTHFKAIFRILRYLKGTPGKGLIFRNKGHIQVEAYTDVDWEGNINDRRSTSGYCTFVGGNLVAWRSKKQNVVARSSAEAEF